MLTDAKNALAKMKWFKNLNFGISFNKQLDQSITINITIFKNEKILLIFYSF